MKFGWASSPLRRLIEDKSRIKGRDGFTIVELLIVIVVVAILASISIIGYSGIQQRAIQSKRDADMAILLKAITLARINTERTLGSITGSYWSFGSCSTPANNPDAAEPRDLSSSHICWTRYYAVLTNIGNAAQMDISSLRSGDARGNPYMLDENEGENGDMCAQDSPIRYFTGNGVAAGYGPAIPKFFSC